MDIDPNEVGQNMVEEEQKRQAASTTPDISDPLELIDDGADVLDADFIGDAISALGNLAGEAAKSVEGLGEVAGEVLGEAASVAGEAAKVIGEIVAGILDS